MLTESRQGKHLLLACGMHTTRSIICTTRPPLPPIPAADYFNPKMVVGCVVEHENKILLCRR